MPLENGDIYISTSYGTIMKHNEFIYITFSID